MNYLVAADRFALDSPGGAWGIAWELAKLMLARGHAVSMLCGSTDADPPPGPSNVEGVEVIRYRYPRSEAWNPARLRLHVRAAFEAGRSSLSNRSWDLVHVHTPAAGRAAWDLARLRGARMIYTVHSPARAEQRINWAGRSWPARLKRVLGLPLVGRAELGLLNDAALVHVLSGFTERALFKEYGSRLRRPVLTVPWWAPEARFEPIASVRERLGWPPAAFKVFTLRRLVPRMGLDVLLEATARAGEGLFVAIGGDGPERARLESQASALGLGDRVRFLGRVSDEDARACYSACDAFALPTRELECFGIPALEAMAYGKPVLGSDAGAIPEVVGSVLAEWIFRAGDPAALASLLARARDGALRRPTGAELAAHAATAYARPRLQDTYVRMLERVAA